MPLRRAIAAAVASGLLLAAAAPPIGLGWLAWVALVPAAAAALRGGDARPGRLALPLAYGVYLELLLVPALPFGLAERQWGDPLLPVLAGDSPVLFAALIGIPLFALALYALRFPFLGFGRGALAPIAVPAIAWTALDLLRAKYDPSGLWGPLFLTQHETAAARLAALAGPWLLTFALVAVNFALALLLVRRRAVLLPAAGTLGAVAVLAVASLTLAKTATSSARVTVAAVQPGYDTAEFERPVLRYFGDDYERASLDLVRDLATLTDEALSQGAEVVAWPEATVWTDPLESEEVRRALRDVTGSRAVTLVVPYFLPSRDHGGALVVLPRGGTSEPKPKQRPMWFLGEKGDNRAPPRPARTPLGELGTLLGVDNQDPGLARRLAAAGADLLTSSTHDWAGLAPEQRAFSQLHAAALALPLVRADWRYGSAIYEAGGRRVADAGGEKRRAVVTASVALAGEATPYARVGDVLGWAALAVAAALVLARLARLVRD